jgi:uncharacterized protein YndB with AHSA1/START domain
MISFQATYRAPLAHLWRAWTDNTALQSWLTVKANVVANVGGAYELFWQPETPEQNSTLGCRVLAVEPMRRLSFEWRGPPQFVAVMNTTPLPTRVEVEFEERAGATTMRFAHLGWGSSPEWDAARAWQEKAWLRAFGELAKYIAATSE